MGFVSRRSFLVGAGASIAAASCVQSRSDPTRSQEDGKVPLADGALLVEYSPKKLRDEVTSGGPPKDGIPSIDDPTFTGVERADERLQPTDIVFGVAEGTDAKAYPQNILVWHEIVNDTLDGTPVSVTYCPLTGTAMGFERGETTFGVSGNLLNNNLVMYDRATDSRWPQMLASAIQGTHEGESLREFRLIWTTWEQWKQRYPQTRVLSEDTGYLRDYGRDPYGSYNPRGGYYTSESTLFSRLQEDDRYPLKQVVMGVRTTDNATAFVKNSLRTQGLIEGKLGDSPVVAVYDSTLDTVSVYRVPPTASVTYEDEEVLVNGSAHAPDDLPFDHVYGFDAMWFAWVGMYPSTRIHA